jgi:aminopeptidase N
MRFNFRRVSSCGVLLTALLLAQAPARAVEETGLLCRHCAAPGESAGGGPRQFAPDRRADILHLTLDVTPDFKARSVRGTATFKFQPIAQPLEQLRLDAVELRVKSLKSSARVAAWQATDEAIIVTFASPVPVGRETTLTIEYSAEPRRGLYFRTPELGYPADELQIWTQGEPWEARHWFPGFDHPNEKFTSEVICHAPEGLAVLSNGKLVSTEKDATTGLVATRWLQDKPHVNYLITLVAGHLRKVEDTYRGLPLELWVPPSDLPEAMNTFRATKDMMAFFEREIDVPYPWAKYGQVVVRDYHWGGMENTSLTTLTDRTLHRADTEQLTSSESLVAHELAHQWFGDLVTCKDWSHLWLNEGFATYYDALYQQHADGEDQFRWTMFGEAEEIQKQFGDTNPDVWREIKKPEEQFGYRAYPKGAWVLHMLRHELGPDLYRRCVKTYLERHAYDTVVTEDLNSVIEELSGRSFDGFFDQWVYRAHHPELDVAYSWDDATKLAKLTVRQTQKQGPTIGLFNVPLTVRFILKSGPVDHRVTVKDAAADFFFPLAEAPRIVRLDPELALLADIKFKPPVPMIHAQLADTRDVIGRALACDLLAERKDAESVKQLGKALATDKFYGVRERAARTLRRIYTDDALAALLAATNQPDARARTAWVSAIGAFRQPAAAQALHQVVRTDKNPMIVANATRALGAHPSPELHELLARQLASDSYRQRLAEAAMDAIRRLDDESWTAPLLGTLKKRAGELPTRVFNTGLATLGHIARHAKDRSAPREFLVAQTTNPRELTRTAAITALGTLADPKALPVLEGFAGASTDTPEKKAADRAITALRGERAQSEEVGALRTEVQSLQKSGRELRDQVEELKKKFEAATGAKASQPKSADSKAKAKKKAPQE